MDRCTLGTSRQSPSVRCTMKCNQFWRRGRRRASRTTLEELKFEYEMCIATYQSRFKQVQNMLASICEELCKLTTPAHSMVKLEFQCEMRIATDQSRYKQVFHTMLEGLCEEMCKYKIPGRRLPADRSHRMQVQARQAGIFEEIGWAEEFY